MGTVTKYGCPRTFNRPTERKQPAMLSMTRSTASSRSATTRSGRWKRGFCGSLLRSARVSHSSGSRPAPPDLACGHAHAFGFHARSNGFFEFVEQYLRAVALDDVAVDCVAAFQQLFSSDQNHRRTRTNGFDGLRHAQASGAGQIVIEKDCVIMRGNDHGQRLLGGIGKIAIKAADSEHLLAHEVEHFIVINAEDFGTLIAHFSNILSHQSGNQ